jgi:hypothetical protein
MKNLNLPPHLLMRIINLMKRASIFCLASGYFGAKQLTRWRRISMRII